MRKLFNQSELDERLIKAKHLTDVESLDNTIAVVYSDTDTIFIYNTNGLTDEEKEWLVIDLIASVQLGSNYTRKIIAKSGNIFFVY
jgi:hypothetical protein